MNFKLGVIVFSIQMGGRKACTCIYGVGLWSSGHTYVGLAAEIYICDEPNHSFLRIVRVMSVISLLR